MSVAKASKISPVDPTAAEPFYRQIYNRFRSAIASGLLKPGDRIPSARALTKELGLARGTIEAAYSLLAAEGYIQARGQAGTIVTTGPQAASAYCKRDAQVQKHHCCGWFSSRFDFAVSNGLACPGCVSSKDLGAPGRAMCACHAAIGHGSSLRLRPAGAAC